MIVVKIETLYSFLLYKKEVSVSSGWICIYELPENDMLTENTNHHNLK